MTDPTYTLRITRNGTKLATEDFAAKITASQRSEVQAWLEGGPSPAPHEKLRACIVCGADCCTVEDCPEPGHETSCEMAAVNGVGQGSGRWVCCEAHWDIAAEWGSSPTQPDTQRTDTDRIAWLNRSHLHVIADSTEGHDITVRISERVWRQNLRDSIDAAMAAAAPKEESK